MKTILLTGANGFIGRNLVEYLQPHVFLLIPRRSELNLNNRNTVKQYLAIHPVDLIIHCASIGGVRSCEDPVTVEKENIGMVENLLTAKYSNTPMIVFGSGAQYNRNREPLKVSETELGYYIPLEPYGKAKMRIAQYALKRDDVLCLTIFGCYGKYEKRNRLPTYALSCAMKNASMVCNQDMLFDYLFVDDLCAIVYSSYFIGLDIKY